MAKLASNMVDSLMANPIYLERLDEFDYDALVDADMSNAEYREWLDSPTVTHREDCVRIILNAAVTFGDYNMPADIDMETLCDWYERQADLRRPRRAIPIHRRSRPKNIRGWQSS